MYTLPPFLPWPLIPFVRLADRAPGTQITLRVSSQILRYTNIYNICPPGEFLVISSRICGEYLPQIFVPTGSLITITDKENVHKNVNNWNAPSSINYFGGYMHFLWILLWCIQCKIFFLKCILANLFFRCIRTRCISWNLFLEIHSSLVKCGSWIPWVKLSWGSI